MKLLVLGVLGMSIFFILVISIALDQEDWEKFKLANNCKVVGKMDGSIGTGVGPAVGGGAAVVIVPTPGKTGWKCDDGITYWREE